MEVIRSKNNQLIKQAKKLHQKKYRKDSYLIEGWHLLEEAQSFQATIERIFVSEEEATRIAHTDKVTVVSATILAELSESKAPQGVVAQIAMPQQELLDITSGKYLVLEDVQDPGNVGTMIRTADAAGFDAVFLTNQSADVYNSKVLRSMQGSHFHLPIYRLPIEDIIAHLKKAEIPIFATTLSSDSIDYKKLGNKLSLALVMGNEGQGISDRIVQVADELVHISMPGQAESLNVAVAAGILMFSFV
ncbi:TrmH family RNA methyltransferase [Streptococcus cameli]